MGRAKRAKQRAKQAAKRRRASSGGEPAKTGRKQDLSQLQPWAVTPEAAARQMAFTQGVQEALERHRTLFRRHNPLLVRHTDSAPPLAHTGQTVFTLANIASEVPRCVSDYSLFGVPVWPAAVQRARAALVGTRLSQSARECLPDASGPAGWLGCWVVRWGRGEQPPEVLDCLAPARPTQVPAGQAAATSAPPGDLRPQWPPDAPLQGLPRARREAAEADPSLFVPHGEGADEDGVWRFIGWRMERDGSSAFLNLLPLTRSQLRGVLGGFWDALRLGRIQSAADWDGYLLAVAVALSLRPDIPRWAIWWLDEDLLQQIEAGWRGAGVSPLMILDALAPLSRLYDEGEPPDPTRRRERGAFRRAARDLLRTTSAEWFSREPGPLVRVADEVELLPVRLAAAGEEADGASAKDRAEVVEAVLDGLRRALGVALIPPPARDPALLRSLWDRSFLERALDYEPSLERLAQWDARTLRARPLAWLGLASDHPVMQALGGHTSVQAALRWADGAAQAQTPPGAEAAARELRRAYATARAEARLCVLLGDPSQLSLLWWQRALALGWRLLFDARAGATPLGDLDIPPRFRGKLLLGLGELILHRSGGLSEDASVADVPPQKKVLLSLPGVGPRSAEALWEALYRHATGWRERFIKGLPARAVAPVAKPVRAEAQANLSAGLDALADLFGSEDSGEDGEG